MSKPMKSPSSLNDDGQNKISSSSEKGKCAGTEKPKLSPIDRFRRIARSVQSQSLWTKALQTKIAVEHSKEFHIVQKSGESDMILSFNTNAFKSAFHSCGRLSKKVKLILMKTPWQRKADEIKVIYGVVDELKCFSRYTPLIKRELARVVYFQQFEDGRVIVQQGHPGRSMYFIVSGCVSVQVTEMDKRTGHIKKQIVGEMFAGDSFGELALLHDIKRAATIICKGTAEFLTVDKPDFDMVLKKGHQKEWETRISLLRSLPYFKDYTPEELEKLNRRAKLIEYPPNTVSDLY